MRISARKGKSRKPKQRATFLPSKTMRSTRQSNRTSAALTLPFRLIERVAFATLPAVVRVQVLPATRDQLVVTHSGEPRDLLAVRAGEWFARVAASRRLLADQPDLVRLDLLLFHDAAKSR